MSRSPPPTFPQYRRQTVPYGKMKNEIFAVLLVLGFMGLCFAQDHVTSLLSNNAYVNKEINCILDNGPCDSIGRQIKHILPEVLNNRCQRCTPYQARNARRLIQFMQERHAAAWRLIVQRYTIPNYYQG